MEASGTPEALGKLKRRLWPGALRPKAPAAPPAAPAAAPDGARPAVAPGTPAKAPSTPGKAPGTPGGKAAGASPGSPAGSQPIQIQQDNPTRIGSEAYLRYERYKAARTVQEFLDLGGTKTDLKYDRNKGFITFV